MTLKLRRSSVLGSVLDTPSLPHGSTRSGGPPLKFHAARDNLRRFGSAKRDSLPQYCWDCDVRFACWGECPKNRFIKTPAGEAGLNYLCEGYKDFFHHIDGPMRLMSSLVREGRSAPEVMRILAKAPRNSPCPCGSTKKAKHCHRALSR